MGSWVQGEVIPNTPQLVLSSVWIDLSRASYLLWGVPRAAIENLSGAPIFELLSPIPAGDTQP